MKFLRCWNGCKRTGENLNSRISIFLQDTAQYFIALLIPSPWSKVITRIKEEFAERYGSRKSLRVAPHITLKAPFYMSNDDIGQLLGWFQKTPLKTAPFEIYLQDFSSFPKQKSPVIFIDVRHDAVLMQLQQQVILSFAKTFEGQPISNHESTFSPHVTIAYRDLTFEQYTEAWKVFSARKFEATFTAEAICLLRHEDKAWKIISERIL